MEVLYPRCAGLDVHKDSVVACMRIASGGEVVTEVQTFNTTTASLVSLSEWLASDGCTHVAMEATGVYWKPVWHILSDSEFTLVLANAAHVKNVPGRKTDINDATCVGRSAGSWSDPSELRAGIRDAGYARAAAHAQTAGPREGQPYPAAAEDARRRQHQTRFGGCGHRGQKRSSDHRCADRRRERSGQAGRSCRHQNQELAEQAPRGAIRKDQMY